MIIPICLASDRNYIQHLSVTMASILKNKAESDSIRFYILENTFIDEDRQNLQQLKSIADFEIEYINVQDQILEICPFNENDRLSIAAYFRLFIPEIILLEDKIIYLDCDIVVRRSLAELYKIEPEEAYILAVRDTHSRKHKNRLGTKHYINSGVLLINSKKMREDRVIDQFIDFINHNRDKILWHDQDVISGTLDEHIRYISHTWNGQLWPVPFSMKYSRSYNAAILHYAGGDKPWRHDTNALMREEYFRYLKLTPFANFENDYRKKRFLWNVSRIPSRLWRLIRSKKSSTGGTYQTYFYFGIPLFKKKRKNKSIDN